MTEKDNSLSRFFGSLGSSCEGLFGNSGLIIIIIAIAFLCFGEELLELILCKDSMLIWIILLILLFMNFDFDGGCC